MGRIFCAVWSSTLAMLLAIRLFVSPPRMFSLLGNKVSQVYKKSRVILEKAYGYSVNHINAEYMVNRINWWHSV